MYNASNRLHQVPKFGCKSKSYQIYENCIESQRGKCLKN